MWCLSLFILLFAGVQCVQISSSLYGPYAVIGMVPETTSTRFSYAAVLKKKNNSFNIMNVFHIDGVAGFGFSVAIGSAPVGDGESAVVAAVSSKEADGTIYIYDVESDCNAGGCDAVITYQTNSTKSSCVSGAFVVAGTNFIASACPSNLLSKNGDPPAFTVCIINILLSYQCEVITSMSLDVSSICARKGGQLIITAMDARDSMLVVSYCAVCSEVNGNTLSMIHVSGFAVYKISNGTVEFVAQTPSSRSASCPSAVAVNSQWVIVGYSDENSVDFYNQQVNASTQEPQYVIQQSISLSSPSGYGSSLDCDDDLAIVSGKGNVASGSFGSANIYGLTGNYSTGSNFSEQLLQTQIPCIQYPVQFNYTFNVNLYNGTILVVTQDTSLIAWAFDTFSTCPAGQGWNASVGCETCPIGMHKDRDNTFSLCTPCASGGYTNVSSLGCLNISCPRDAFNNSYFCPAGSASPIPAMTAITITSTPNPLPSAPLDFEDTFFYSCYPYFILFLTLVLTVAIPVCCTWPNKTKTQKKLVTLLLNVNFFYWPEGDEENFFMEEPKKPLLTTSINSDGEEEDADKRREVIEKRRKTHIDQFLGSLCSYFFAAMFVLMIVFCTVFMANGYNNSTEIDLRTVDENALVNNSFYESLSIMDTSPFKIDLQLYGYNGECIRDEIDLTLDGGCSTLDFQSDCFYNLSAGFVTNSSFPYCLVTASFAASRLQQQTIFALNFLKPNFYAQQVQYNISTMNDENALYHGNAFVVGAFQPFPGNILRGNVTLELLTILTWIGDCQSQAVDNEVFLTNLVRLTVQNCTANNQSFKDFSLLSTRSAEIPAQFFNFLNSSGFTFNLVLVKSPFYNYVTQSYYVSLAAILGITMMAALDVYWIIEAVCPWLGFVLFQLQSLLISFSGAFKSKSKTGKRNSFS